MDRIIKKILDRTTELLVDFIVLVSNIFDKLKKKKKSKKQDDDQCNCGFCFPFD